MPHSVELGETVFSTGEKRIGEGSTYQVTSGSITFRKSLDFRGDHELEFFVNSGPVPAKPGTVIVPCCEPFTVHQRDQPCQAVFSTTEERRLQMHAKLNLEFVHC